MKSTKAYNPIGLPDARVKLESLNNSDIISLVISLQRITLFNRFENMFVMHIFYILGHEIIFQLEKMTMLAFLWKVWSA